MKNIGIYLFLIGSFCGCTTPGDFGLKYKGNTEAQGVISYLPICKVMTEDAFENVQKCFYDSLGKNDLIKNEIKLKGHLKIENGYLFIYSMEFESTSATSNYKKEIDFCISKEAPSKKKNVAHGIKYYPALLKRDHMYEFHGIIVPKIAGEVKSVEYGEVEKF